MIIWLVGGTSSPWWLRGVQELVTISLSLQKRPPKTSSLFSLLIVNEVSKTISCVDQEGKLFVSDDDASNCWLQKPPFVNSLLSLTCIDQHSAFRNGWNHSPETRFRTSHSNGRSRNFLLQLFNRYRSFCVGFSQWDFSRKYSSKVTWLKIW